MSKPLPTGITILEEVCNGKPTIRGMRITVQTIMEFLLNGTTVKEILEQYPMLTEDDIAACKAFTLAVMDNRFQVKEFAA
jgi:uncharacterized protein (DUF433 family)